MPRKIILSAWVSVVLISLHRRASSSSALISIIQRWCVLLFFGRRLRHRRSFSALHLRMTFDFRTIYSAHIVLRFQKPAATRGDGDSHIVWSGLGTSRDSSKQCSDKLLSEHHEASVGALNMRMSRHRVHLLRGIMAIRFTRVTTRSRERDRGESGSPARGWCAVTVGRSWNGI